MTGADSNRSLNVAVFGAGVFGRNHLRVYRQLEHSGLGVRLAAVADTDPAAAEMLRQQEDLPVFHSPEECL
jgi:predicted dehydrogenase